MADDKNIEVKLKNVRGSFIHLATPQENRDKKTKEITSYSYNGNFLIPKKLEDGSENPVIKELQEVMRRAIEGRWPGQSKKIPADRRCLHDGEPKDPDTGEREALYDGYEGHVYISANQRVSIEEYELIRAGKKDVPVQLLGSRKGPDGKFPRLKGAEAAALFYSGAYFDLIIRIYGYDGSKHENPDRVNASLEAVKFKRHGQSFGTKPVDADSMFDEEEDDELDDLTSGSGTKPSSKVDDDDMLG